MKILMGLDYGARTVGVAVSDPFGWTAQGVRTIHMDENKEIFGLDEVQEMIKKFHVQGFVLGLPLNMNGTAGPRVDACKKYGDMLKKRFHLPVDYQDERLTTVQGERMMIEGADVSRRKRRKVIDTVAAELILQTYLDRKGPLTKLDSKK
ncbi:Holliday junction resolvase RuvX [Acetilactobacillus jinshanensis]|uniref:Putative pre-16S rRNA nuclease n=1 Tax=Acetilactobacillus jinshanensis TaxID=1720083 RepID=A0A4P6ZLN6_9LACO|nr:Holliday junction resolvase RuvX [Acetilactobacillus jinshanensis]QBP18736.1 Holliday junction resolvase RuvX [Acetilactobacillus jinshanensis]URL61608.1 Holliday junction resolvase RuvX [uncultured bacterium]